ncbi:MULTISPECIES: signal peptide peptidase SppA [unclassified Clostridium]|uniref:signal peptide peptidase SppA n=1 Tax=unclassified Clostridium TaxID=2614128 RepID=UPI0002985711|nr:MULTISPECIES: signal peptide peptidase SppA [unclassified Clostridium]EKQ51614.1 MAG: signal peptide peptidase SppA, 36K type [Clostridium sp. Maddingley MBC34-26]
MNKKQIIGLIAAAVAFVFINVASVITKTISDNMVSKNDQTKKTLESMLNSEKIALPNKDFIGVVKVEGTIKDTSDSSNIFQNTQSYNHKQILKYIDSMIESKNNKGIILYVDSPGGGVYESDELYLKLKEYKEKKGCPVWTYMASEACSGGYYVSMAADKIYANRNTWTGSIGVIVSSTNVKGLYDKLGIKEIDITSGPNKAMGSPGMEMTDEQHKIMQSLVDEAYEQFTGVVAEGRKMDINKVKPIADGRVYSAKQALDLGLIDNIDTYENMKKSMLDTVGKDVEIFTPENKSNILSSLFAKAESLKPKSDAQVISEQLEKENNGGLMYYAETK